VDAFEGAGLTGPQSFVVTAGAPAARDR